MNPAEIIGLRASVSGAQMAKGDSATLFLFFTFLMMISYSYELQSSQVQTLLRIQRLLNSPPVLSSWNDSTDFCNIEPAPSLTVVCYEGTITQLHIFGQNGSPALPRNFSIGSFFTTLVKLPSLKVISLVSLGLWGPLPAKITRFSSLEILNMSSNFLYGPIPPQIWSLRSLQTLILDSNMFRGQIPDWVSALPVLAVLSLKNNSLSGSIPNSLRTLENLRVLDLSNNRLAGEVPDFGSLTNLQVLKLADNFLGSLFPTLGKKLVTLELRNNRFSSGVPSEIASCYQLQRLDISLNRFVGPFPPSLLSLPSIHYLNISGNRLSGLLFENMSCNGELEYVDLSANLLSGNLPICLVSDSKSRVVQYSRNCLETAVQNQHPHWFCQNQALAVGIANHDKKERQTNNKVIVLLSTLGGITGLIVLSSLLILLVRRRMNMRRVIKRPPRTLVADNHSTGIPSKLLSDARYISQSMKLGALGLPAYRTFSLEELEEATNNFDTSSFMGEGSHGQMYRGMLSDGSVIALRCLKLKQKHTTQNFVHHIELISKLRHQHLVSALGHCFECYLDDSSVSRIFIAFEYVPNGTLRSNISGGVSGQILSWAQRISAAIGIAKGIQFLHAGIVPGIYANDLKITNVLLDQNLVAKISSYNLPVLTENMKNEDGTGVSSNVSKDKCAPGRVKQDDKTDMYDFGVILLELITGTLITSQDDVDALKGQLRRSIAADESAQRSPVDPAVLANCSDESLKTVMQICIRCLSKEPTKRPSIEDVLWNMQFAAQVQETWKGDSQSSDGSPESPHRPTKLQLTIQQG
ncbi:probable inactive leucine-rich repeat receptor-like protein kinase At3g03770 [Aristolochia californica]|uniref:probable inactive leucine-rich repeat receptor-like protein kinase At3g03770 n=1 Tax=Aristolochia californica TaxID=171875 RepID=UPI0035DC1851